MSLLTMSIPERLECLQDLLSCTGQLYRWTYDHKGNLIETSCPDTVLHKVFISTGCLETILQKDFDLSTPVLMSISYGLNWGVSYETQDGQLLRVHVIGPTSTTEVQQDGLTKAIQSARIPNRWRPKFIKILKRIPCVSTIDFMRQILMLHFCVTGTKLTNADIRFIEPQNTKDNKEVVAQKDRMNTYMMEQALMRMITEGDLDYKSVLHDAASASRGVHASAMGSLEQVKISLIVFISLCTRAAIQGGITPETAYSRGDAYIQDIVDCKTVADAAHIGHTMYNDFIHLVHNKQVDLNLSPSIQNCCDYIYLHTEEKISLAKLAKRFGYVDYYLSRKFKQETGVSINDYIKIAKIEKAKTLLLSSDLSIQEICDRLQFGSRSFFAETFKDITGQPPAAYRKQHSV